MKKRDIDHINALLETNIPTASSIVGEVMRVIYDPKSDAKDIAEIIERDPPISAKILRVANSAYYGSKSSINSLKRAVVVLGFNTVKELITTIALVDNFFDPHSHVGIDRKGLWVHSVATARAAHFLAKKTGIVGDDIAYTVGLLHDIGKVLLSTCLPEEYSEVIYSAETSRTYIVTKEKLLLNIDHCRVGRMVCEKWNLPSDVSLAIESHHTAHENRDPLVSLIRLADTMTRRANIGNPGDFCVPEPDIIDLRILGRSVSRRLQIFGSCYGELKEQENDINDFFSHII